MHIGSSLEHEVWQELTGYDAVSTVRGIQMALAGGSALLNPKKNSTEDTLPGLYPSLGFSTTVSSAFTYTPFTIFSTAPATWTHATANSAFDTFLSTINAATSPAQKEFATYIYSPSSRLYGWSKCVSDQISAINAYASNVTISGSTCAGTPFSGLKSTVLNIISQDWTNNIIPNAIGQTLFDYFDRNKSFNTTGRVYRSYPLNANAYDTSTVTKIRNNLYRQDPTQFWVEYLLPSTLVTGPNNYFEVSIRKDYLAATGRLSSLTFEILNHGH